MRFASIRRKIVATAAILMLSSCSGGGGNVGPDPVDVDESSARHLPIRVSLFQIQPDTGLVVYQLLASRQWAKTQGADWRADVFAAASEKIFDHIRKQPGKRDDLFAITGKPLANFDVPDFWMEKTVESMEVSGIRDLPSRKIADAAEILRMFQSKRKEDGFVAIAVTSPTVNTVVVSRDIRDLQKEQQERMFPALRKVIGAFSIMFNKFRPAYMDNVSQPPK